MLNPDIFTSVINSYLPEPHASLLNGILFGINLTNVKDFYEELKIVGLLHLVVLSGINITLLGSMIGLITKSFSKIFSVTITIVVIVLFILFVGAKPPIVRAGFMGVLTLVSIVYGRKAMALYLLLLSAIFIGIFWPDWLSTISFQLSYGATLGIILLGQAKIKKVSGIIPKLKQEFLRELKTTVSAQVLTVPIIFFYFKQVSLISPIANILIAFTIPPLMVFGFLAAVLGKIHFIFGIIPAIICYGILSYIVWVVEFLSKLPFVYFSF